MRSKWLTIGLIFVGIILLLFSSYVDDLILHSRKNMWVKIVGIVLLMIGIYKTSQATRTTRKKEEEEREEGKERV